MDIFNFDPNEVLSFYLTLIRITIVVFMMPFFGGKPIPNMVKAAFSLVLSLAVFPALAFPATMFPSHPFEIGIIILGEALLGTILGMIVRVLISAVQTGGNLIGFQMGFAMVNVMDPDTGAQESATAHFLYMSVLLTFLALNGHLHMINALAMTFKWVPPGGIVVTPQLTMELVVFTEQLFTLAIRIAAPVMGALFLVDLALALISRAAPQMNVLVLGFPVKITVGFVFISFVLEFMNIYVSEFIRGMDGLFSNIIRSLGG